MTDKNATFRFDRGTLDINVPQLYCEVVGAPQGFAEYCLYHNAWRRVQLLELASRVEKIAEPFVGGFAREQELDEVEALCRNEARAMLNRQELTQWHELDTARARDFIRETP